MLQENKEEEQFVIFAWINELILVPPKKKPIFNLLSFIYN